MHVLFLLGRHHSCFVLTSKHTTLQWRVALVLDTGLGSKWVHDFNNIKLTYAAKCVSVSMRLLSRQLMS